MNSRIGLCLMLLGFAATHAAQAQGGKGSISGTVVDAGNAVLQGARVELSPGGNVTVTGNDGSFRFGNLTPNTYNLRISFVGFSVDSETVTVTASQPARLACQIESG